MSTAVEFKNISRVYGDIKAVDSVSMAIGEGEFFSMLGPSGSGKTTCLRLIAGFEQPSRGSILLHGKEAAGVPPFLRDVNTVFQDYALFPHMNVRDNVAYGLMVRGVSKRERYASTEEALAMVALQGYGDRKPSQLSGGQRQRVALARALINRPRVLLLDEPLGALDLKLREQMQGELKSLQRKLGITFVYVTHDQSEALSMSDRVAVFHKGHIEQVDTPRNLYTRPATVFVANFVGTSNVIEGERAQALSGQAQAFSIRPENIILGPKALDAPDMVQVYGIVKDVRYHGATSGVDLNLEDGGRLVVNISNGGESDASIPALGERICASWRRQAMVFLKESAE